MTSAANSRRAVPVDGAALLEIASAATGAGGAVWVRVRGASMHPSIPSFSDVRVSPIPQRGIRRSDVVLARREDGHPVVHRVWLSLAGRLWLKGDFRITPDRSIATGDVVGLVDAVSVGGKVGPIARRASLAPRNVAIRWRAFLRDAFPGG